MYSLCTELENRVLYCFEYHKQVEYSVECAGMCLNHNSPTWNDEFLNSQGICTLFAFNESCTSGTNCKLCLLLNGGEVYQVNTSDIVADYVFLNPNHETGTESLHLSVKQKRTSEDFTHLLEITRDQFQYICNYWIEARKNGMSEQLHRSQSCQLYFITYLGTSRPLPDSHFV